jgi:hypothetical protein
MQSRVTSWEPLLCVPVGVLVWLRSVAKGPSSFRFLILISSPRWSRGGTWLAQCHVPCVPCTVALTLVFAALLLLLPVVLDVASSRLKSRGVTSYARAIVATLWSVFIHLVSFFSSLFLCAWARCSLALSITITFLMKYALRRVYIWWPSYPKHVDESKQAHIHSTFVRVYNRYWLYCILTQSVYIDCMILEG